MFVWHLSNVKLVRRTLWSCHCQRFFTEIVNSKSVASFGGWHQQQGISNSVLPLDMVLSPVAWLSRPLPLRPVGKTVS